MRVRTSGLGSGPWGKERVRRDLWVGIGKWLGPGFSVGWILVGACGWGYVRVASELGGGDR